MIPLFSAENDNKLVKHDDTDFQMEQLLIQPTDPSYPPVLYTYHWEKVYELVDRGEDVTEYIDYAVMQSMKDTLDQLEPHEMLNGCTGLYKSILDTWG